jgi:hypothetical protein
MIQVSSSLGAAAGGIHGDLVRICEYPKALFYAIFAGYGRVKQYAIAFLARVVVPFLSVWGER